MFLDDNQTARLTSNATTSLNWGTEVSGSTITYAFAPRGTNTIGDEFFVFFDDITAEGFNPYEQTQIRTALSMIEAVIDVRFAEITSYSSADLRLMLDTNEIGEDGTLGVFAPPGELGGGLGIFNGDFWSRNPGGDLEVGGFSFVTITHELLHGLGMSHPHDDGGGSPVMRGVTSPFDDFGTYDLNQGVFTTMSFNSGLLQDGGIGAVSDGLDFGYEAGPMALDIAVLQDKYGANRSHASGGNTYDLPDRNASGTFWQSIWDTGGDDTLRYRGERDATIDLRAATLLDEVGGGGFLSAANGIQGGFTIANGVVIENAQGGSGHDDITGNGAANFLRAGDGDDRLAAAGGNDTLNGDGGNDTLAGGKGDDRLFGAGGSDSLVGQAGSDSLFGGANADTLKGGGGDDRLEGGAGADFLKGGTRGDVLNGGQSNDRLFGNRDDDRINGGAGNDLLNGGGGSDRLNGGSGNDTMKGGDGADDFVFEAGRDLIEDFNLNRDRLLIDSDLLSGQRNGDAVVSSFGEMRSGDAVLEFGGGDLLRLEGVRDLGALADLIEIF